MMRVSMTTGVPARIGPLLRRGTGFWSPNRSVSFHLRTGANVLTAQGDADIDIAPPNPKSFIDTFVAKPPSFKLIAMVVGFGLVLGKTATFFMAPVFAGLVIAALASEFTKRHATQLRFQITGGDVHVVSTSGGIDLRTMSGVSDVTALARTDVSDDEDRPDAPFVWRFSLANGTSELVDPARYGLTPDLASVTQAAYAMRIALGLSTLPEKGSVPDFLLTPVSPSPPRRALTERTQTTCVHALVTLAEEGGPLDLYRCPECRGAHMPSSTSSALLRERLGLSKADIEDLSALFSGATHACAECGGKTSPIRLRGVMVDMCRGCGGIWLDAGEERAFTSLFGDRRF